MPAEFASPQFHAIQQLAALVASLLLSPPADAQALSDATPGALPAAQGWDYAALPGTASQTLTGGAVTLDTTITATEHAGYGRSAPTPLNRTNGFSLLFTAQLHTEAHTSTNRAGFSIIVLGEDKRGIELGFWTNRIFAQADSPLFTHAEDAAFDAANAFVDYTLTLLTTNYVLRANGTPFLSGPVRDYTAFVGPLDPYETPNFIFLGDDTGSALASVSLKRVVLIPAPRLFQVRGNVMGWTGVSRQTYTVQASTNLVQWTAVATVTSATSDFSFTNTVPAPYRFWRVAYP